MTQVKWWNTLQALETLAKHLGLLQEYAEPSGGFDVRGIGIDHAQLVVQMPMDG